MGCKRVVGGQVTEKTPALSEALSQSTGCVHVCVQGTHERQTMVYDCRVEGEYGTGPRGLPGVRPGTGHQGKGQALDHGGVFVGLPDLPAHLVGTRRQRNLYTRGARDIHHQLINFQYQVSALTHRHQRHDPFAHHGGMGSPRVCAGVDRKKRSNAESPAGDRFTGVSWGKGVYVSCGGIRGIGPAIISNGRCALV